MQLYSFEGSHRTLDEINAIKKERELKVEEVGEPPVGTGKAPQVKEKEVKKVKKSKKK